MPRARTVLAAGVALAVAAALGACAPVSDPDAGIRIVASTNVYGDLAETIGGEFVSVTSVIDDAAKDPHEYEADARTQLALSKADLVVRNGGGYDDFIDTMLAASGNDDVTMIDAVEVSGFDTDAADFNEHVWYDYQTVAQVVTALESRMSALDPVHADEFASNASQLQEGTRVLAGRCRGSERRPRRRPGRHHRAGAALPSRGDGPRQSHPGCFQRSCGRRHRRAARGAAGHHPAVHRRRGRAAGLQPADQWTADRSRARRRRGRARSPPSPPES